MGTFDIVLLIGFGSFVLMGFWFGLIQTVGSLAGLVLGAVAASRLYTDVSYFLQFFFLKKSVADFVSFIVIFLLISKLVGFIFYRIQKAFKVVAFLPLVGLANRLAGAALGFVEGAIVLGVVLMFAGQFFAGQPLGDMIANSQLAQLFIKIGKILTPLIIDALRSITS